jgi:diaminobutyrate-2-oxoglutarate transaminase
LPQPVAAARIYESVRARESAARTYADAVDRVIEKGCLTRVTDTEGREYLDFLACAGALPLGHNHPEVTAKVVEHLRSGQVQQALDLTTPAKGYFLDLLYEALPQRFSRQAKVQFCSPAGTDATEAALKLFKTVSGRSTILAFHGSYHGMTTGSLSVTGNLRAKEIVPGLMPYVHFLPYPYEYRCQFGLGHARTADVSLAYIARLLDDPESGIARPAAVIVEAVQGEGGVIPAPARWLRGLREVTAAHEIPLILDEVQTGLGRTGTMFAFEEADIEPDAILISKAIGGGFPLSLLVYHEKYDRWRSGAHAGTFRGNQIAMVSGAATLEIIARDSLVTKAREKGEYLAERFAELAGRHPEIGDVRGRGLMWGLEIVDPAGRPDHLGSLPADGQRARTIKRRCLENGLIVETGGRHGAVIRILPPLIVTYAELDEMLIRLEKSLTG